MPTMVVLQAIIAIALSLSALGCAPSAERSADEPHRIVSLDYCADQYVLRFADKKDIVSLSPDADKRFSYMRKEAKGFRQVRPRAADVLALEPSVVVRSYGGGPHITGLLGRADVSVVQIGFPRTIAEVRGEILRVGDQLGNPSEARAVARDMDRRLAALAKNSVTKPQALYMTPAGVTGGAGTLIHELLVAAGLSNFQDQRGWNPLPLERLAYERPDLIVAAFFESTTNHVDRWSAAHHPIAQTQLRELPVASIEGAWTACGGWFLVEAVEVMAQTLERAP